MTECGYLGAFITKVKRGSIADTIAHLKAGEAHSLLAYREIQNSMWSRYLQNMNKKLLI